MHRELLNFSIFGKSITLYSYGLFISIALILGILVFYRLAEKKGLNTSRIFDNIVMLILVGLIGARIGYVLTHLEHFRKNPWDALKIWQGGLIFYGAFLGGLIYCLIWLLKEERQNLWKWLDAALPALVLGNGIGKIGCFLNGCCYGRQTHFSLAVKIPLLEDNIPRHPVQIYEALAYLLVFFILLVVQKRKIFDGFIFFFGLILHSLARFSLECFREWLTPIKIFKITFSDAQIVCAILIFCAIIGLVLIKNYGQKNYPKT